MLEDDSVMTVLRAHSFSTGKISLDVGIVAATSEGRWVDRATAALVSAPVDLGLRDAVAMSLFKPISSQPCINTAWKWKTAARLLAYPLDSTLTALSFPITLGEVTLSSLTYRKKS